MSKSVEEAKKHFYKTHTAKAGAALRKALEAEVAEQASKPLPQVEAVVATEEADEDEKVEFGSLNPAVLYES